MHIHVSLNSSVVLQNLNKFVEQHGSSTGGDYFLGDTYSFAEVAATPFVHRASAALPALRGFSVDKAIEQQKLTRLDAWTKVTCLSSEKFGACWLAQFCCSTLAE